MIVRTLENVEDMDAATLHGRHRVGLRDVPRVPRARSRRRGTVLNFTAYVGHSALRLYVMGDAAYERAATADEIDAHVRARARGDRRRRGRVLDQLLVRAPRRRRQAGAEPLRRAPTRSRRCSCAAGEAGKGVVLITPGEQCTYADVYEWQPRVGRPFTYPLFARAGRQAPRAGRAAREGLARAARRCGRRSRRGRSPCSSRWPSPYSLNIGTVFGELMKVEPRRAPRRVPRSRVAGARPRPTSRSRR